MHLWTSPRSSVESKVMSCVIELRLYAPTTDTIRTTEKIVEYFDTLSVCFSFSEIRELLRSLRGARTIYKKDLSNDVL
jgi:hypothetical protein